MEHMDYRPDWSVVRTPKAAEADITDFEFKGEGWYIKGNDTILVRRFDSRNYTFDTFNSRDPRETFRKIAYMPVREEAQRNSQ